MPGPVINRKLTPWELMLAALSAWLVPGAGHYYLGLRKRAVMLFVCIELTFLFGLYIGTIRVVDSRQSGLWFLPQIFAGLNTIVAHLWSRNLDAGQFSPLIRDWSYHMGVLYTGVAGLLNLLAVFDTVIRIGRANIGQQPIPAD